MERTLTIIKPDAVSAGRIGVILAQLEGEGFRLAGIKMLRLSVGQARAFYAVHRERPFYEGLVRFMTLVDALYERRVMLFASVIGLEWRRVLKVLGVLHLVLAAASLAGVALFFLDAVQLRGTVPAASAAVFSAAIFRAGIVGLAAGLTLAAAGVAALRGDSAGRRDRRSSKPPVLVTHSRAGSGT